MKYISVCESFNTVVENTESSNYKYYRYRKISDDLISGLFLEDSINHIIPEHKLNYSNKRISEASTSMIDYILYRTKDSKNNKAIISRDDFCFFLHLNKGLVGLCLKTLTNAGIISISRKGTINGVNVITIYHNKVKEIENKGREIEKKKQDEYLNKKYQVIEESKQRIINNQNKIKAKKKDSTWSKEKVEAVNKMAFDEVNEKDVHNTGLHSYDRLLIQILSKAWFRYTGKKLNWNSLMLNKIRKTLTGSSLSEENPTRCYIELGYNLIPQKLIDVIKYITSIWFRPLTECRSYNFELMFTDAYNKKFNQVMPIIYNESSYFDLYKNPKDMEDFNFYKDRVDTTIRYRLKKNSFNHLTPRQNNELYFIASPFYKEKLKEKIFI